MLGGDPGWSGDGDDHVDAEPHELRREVGQPLDLPVGVAALEDDPLAFEVAAATQGLRKGEPLHGIRGAVPQGEVAETVHLAYPLHAPGAGRGKQGHHRDDEHDPREHLRAAG